MMRKIYILLMNLKGSITNDDGVVKSPIYFALVICQTFDVQRVLLQAWQITKSCIWALFLSHLNTFFEGINDKKERPCGENIWLMICLIYR